MPEALKNYKQDSRRKIVLKPGLITFQNERISCVVLNISAGGAGLVLENDDAIPFAFELEINGEQIRRRCLLVWRNDRHLGVLFNTDQHRTPRRRATDDPAASPEMER
jgi:PilZ domain